MPDRISILETLTIVLCSIIIIAKMQFENRFQETSDVVTALKQEVISLQESKTYLENQLKESSDAVVNLKKELYILNENNAQWETSFKESTSSITSLNRKVKETSDTITSVQKDMKGTSHTVIHLKKEVDLLKAVKPIDCTELKSFGNKTGIYIIHPTRTDGVKVFCDMDTMNKGWTVIQRRYNGGVDFYRNWVDYKHGFGNVQGEYWLGNKHINQLTEKEQYTLRIVMEDFENNVRYVEYKTFYLENENHGYKLHVSGFYGDTGDSLNHHNGHMFSTKDKDNDALSGTHCSQANKGGWWYGSCHSSNLNGLYLNGKTDKYAKGMVWNLWKGYYYSLKSSTMMIRRIED